MWDLITISITNQTQRPRPNMLVLLSSTICSIDFDGAYVFSKVTQKVKYNNNKLQFVSFQNRRLSFSSSSSSKILCRKFGGDLMGRTGLFDLEKHFAFYGAYHSNPLNILIHTIFVWPIFFTTLVYLYFTPPLFQSPLQLGFFHYGLIFNYGFFFAAFYALFYVSLDYKAGSLAAFLCFACWAGSSVLAQRLGFSLAWKVVLAAQLLCWTGQFIGHGVFEKRAPALLDNFVQAVLMAPFFVLLEVLQFFGYEPYPGFHSRVKSGIEADIKEWQDKKAKKHS